MAPATMDDQRPDQATHFPFQVSTMASITLSDNVLNATETATVTFTFDADYALAPANITAIGGTLSTPVAFPPGQSRVWQAPIPPRHNGHTACRLHDHREQRCRRRARTEQFLHR